MQNSRLNPANVIIIYKMELICKYLSKHCSSIFTMASLFALRLESSVHDNYHLHKKRKALEINKISKAFLLRSLLDLGLLAVYQKHTNRKCRRNG